MATEGRAVLIWRVMVGRLARARVLETSILCILQLAKHVLDPSEAAPLSFFVFGQQHGLNDRCVGRPLIRSAC